MTATASIGPTPVRTIANPGEGGHDEQRIASGRGTPSYEKSKDKHRRCQPQEQLPRTGFGNLPYREGRIEDGEQQGCY